MKLWNMAEVLHSPKNITVSLNRPLLVLNPAFHWSSSTISQLLYPHCVIVICEVYVTAISLGCQYNAPDI